MNTPLTRQGNCSPKHRVSFSATQSRPRDQVLRNAFDWWKKSKGSGDCRVCLGANSSVLQRRLSGRDSASTQTHGLSIWLYCVFIVQIIDEFLTIHIMKMTLHSQRIAFVLVFLGSGMGTGASIFPCWLPFSLSSLLQWPLFCSPVLLYLFALGSFVSSVSGCACAPVVLLWSEFSLQLHLFCHRSGRKGRPSGCLCLSLVHPKRLLSSDGGGGRTQWPSRSVQHFPLWIRDPRLILRAFEIWMTVLFATGEAKPGPIWGTAESLKLSSQIFVCAINV